MQTSFFNKPVPNRASGAGASADPQQPPAAQDNNAKKRHSIIIDVGVALRVGGHGPLDVKTCTSHIWMVQLALVAKEEKLTIATPTYPHPAGWVLALAEMPN